MIELPGNAAQSEGVFLHECEFKGITEGLNRTRKWALAKNKRLTDAFIARTFEVEGITDPGDPQIIKEHEFFLCNADGSPVNPPVPGHTDEMHWYPKCGILFVFDSKFGRLPVAPAEINGQLRMYFVMACDEIEEEVKKTFCAIRQPFLSEPEDFHSTFYEPADKEVARKELLDTIAACYAPGAPRKVSAEACQYCRAKGTNHCPESIKFITDVNRYRVISMNPREMEKLADVMRGAQTIIDGWKARLRYIANRYPGLLTHHQLGKQTYTSTLNDPVKAFEVLYRQGIFGDTEKYEALTAFVKICCDASIPKLAEHLESKTADEKFNGREMLTQTLGEQIEGDEQQNDGALITLKPKERRLFHKKIGPYDK